MKKLVVTGIMILIMISEGLSVFGQQPFAVYLQPSVLNIPATHSGAFASRNGKWFFIGGRIDGLHIMQAMQAFPAYGRNDSIYIVDPVLNTHVSLDATLLAPDIYQAVTSSNMQYYQDGSHLYMIGGYGRMASQNTWITFPSLISVDLDCLLSAAASGTSPVSCFRQIIDTSMAVCGGMLEKIDSTYQLVFGHRFDGQYARTTAMGMFTQQYTNEIRRFVIHDDGMNLSISNYTTLSDTTVFHRRDFNLVPQIFPSGEYGLTAFGGVFQKNADLPYLTPIDITSATVVHQSGFNQNLSQYTSAVVPVYDSVYNEMHTLFFGGMSLYTLDTTTQTLVQDTAVPFVNTISKITRDATGTLHEFKLPEDMPGLIGSNALFIPENNLSLFDNRIILLNHLNGLTRIGYIVGGIQSDHPNIGLLDPESMSRPNAQVYEVYLDKNVSSTNEILIRNTINDLAVYPNPAKDKFVIEFSVRDNSKTNIDLFDLNGKFIRSFLSEENLSGKQSYQFSLHSIKPGAYLCRVQSGDSVKGVQLIIGK